MHLHAHPENGTPGYCAPEIQLLLSCFHTCSWEFSLVFRSTQCNWINCAEGQPLVHFLIPPSCPCNLLSVQKPQQSAAMLTGSGCLLNNGTSLVPREEITEKTSNFFFYFEPNTFHVLGKSPTSWHLQGIKAMKMIM